MREGKIIEGTFAFKAIHGDRNTIAVVGWRETKGDKEVPVTFVGEARRRSTDRDESQIGMDLSIARALEQAARFYRKRAAKRIHSADAERRRRAEKAQGVVIEEYENAVERTAHLAAADVVRAVKESWGDTSDDPDIYSSRPKTTVSGDGTVTFSDQQIDIPLG
jgi:hypothetical protein